MIMANRRISVHLKVEVDPNWIVLPVDPEGESPAILLDHIVLLLFHSYGLTIFHIFLCMISFTNQDGVNGSYHGMARGVEGEHRNIRTHMILFEAF